MAVGLALACGMAGLASTTRPAMPGLDEGVPAAAAAGAAPSAVAAAKKKAARKKAKKKRAPTSKPAPGPAVPAPAKAAAKVPREELLARYHARLGAHREVRRGPLPVIVRGEWDGDGGPVIDPMVFEAGRHPFFLVDPAEDTGHFQIFHNSTAVDPGFHHVVRTKEGFMFWLGDRGNVLHVMTADGGYWRSSLPGNNTRYYSLVKHDDGRIAFFGDRNNGWFTTELVLRGWNGKDLPLEISPWSKGQCRLAAGPMCAIVPPGRSPMGVTAANLFAMDHDNRDQHICNHCHPSAGPVAAAWCEPMQTMAAVQEGRDGMLTWRPGQGTLDIIDLPEGSRPRGIAADPRHRLWVTLPGLDQLMVVTFDESSSVETRSFTVKGSDGLKPSGPGSIALGPDGNMWTTFEKSKEIVRMTPDFAITSYPVPGNLTPLDISSSGDGRMFFRVAENHRLYAIKVFPAKEEKAATAEGKDEAPAAAAAGAGPRARVVRRKPSREERHRRLDKSIRLAEARYQARLKWESDGAGPLKPMVGEAPSAAGAAGAPEPAMEAAVPVPVTAGLRPHERLQEIGFFLGRAASEHIFNCHAYGKMAGKSQFNAAYGTREALDEIIAKGIEEAGPRGWGAIMTDSYGRYYTLCQRRGTDWYRTGAGWEATDLFVVVTDRYYNEAVGDYDHVVITAYPVSKDW
jgi:hypothetical protein